MSTILIIVALLAIGGVVVFFGMKAGKIEDKNNNNIPDAIEEKLEQVEKAAEVVKETAKKVKKTAEKATKVAKTVVVERKPRAKKTTK
jgi:ppGpp synthetase/RelA/SpoT-type nucleotidyltranferase